MKRTVVWLVPALMSLLLPVTALAADAHAEAVALLEAMNARARYEEVVLQMQKQLGTEAGTVPSDLMDRIFNEMARIYSEVYTADELAAIREFYLNPAGQAFLRKQPLMTEKYVEVLKSLTTER